MIQELLYTSHAGRGLRSGGGGGFCTVLSTEGMATNVASALEKLSGYKHPFSMHDPRAEQNPVNFRHAQLKIGGVQYSVLSRIADLRQEHTGRSNKLAHHVAFTKHALPQGGPVQTLMHDGFCRDSWDGEVELVPPVSTLRLPNQTPRLARCIAWEKVAGDAGWAGSIADSLLQSSASTQNVIYPLGVDALELVSEIFLLIPAEKRWSITFSTLYTSTVPGSNCNLRFFLDGMEEADQLRRDRRLQIVDLTKSLGAVADTPRVLAARSGDASLLQSKPRRRPKPQAKQPESKNIATGTDGEIPDIAKTNPFEIDNELPELDDEYELEPTLDIDKPPKTPASFSPLRTPRERSQKSSNAVLNPLVLGLAGLVAFLLCLCIGLGAYVLWGSNNHEKVAGVEKDSSERHEQERSGEPENGKKQADEGSTDERIDNEDTKKDAKGNSSEQTKTLATEPPKTNQVPTAGNTGGNTAEQPKASDHTPPDNLNSESDQDPLASLELPQDSIPVIPATESASKNKEDASKKESATRNVILLEDLDPSASTKIELLGLEELNRAWPEEKGKVVVNSVEGDSSNILELVFERKPNDKQPFTGAKLERHESTLEFSWDENVLKKRWLTEELLPLANGVSFCIAKITQEDNTRFVAFAKPDDRDEIVAHLSTQIDTETEPLKYKGSLIAGPLGLSLSRCRPVDKNQFENIGVKIYCVQAESSGQQAVCFTFLNADSAPFSVLSIELTLEHLSDSGLLGLQATPLLSQYSLSGDKLFTTGRPVRSWQLAEKEIQKWIVKNEKQIASSKAQIDSLVEQKKELEASQDIEQSQKEKQVASKEKQIARQEQALNLWQECLAVTKAQEQLLKTLGIRGVKIAMSIATQHQDPDMPSSKYIVYGLK